MTIRPAIIQDIPQLSTLKKPKNEEHRLVYETFARKHVESSKPEEFAFLVLEDEGKILGHVFLQFNGNETEPGYPNMQDLFIAEELRNKGLGQKLIQECERIAKEKSYHKISVAVNPTLNLRAKTLYERLGYVDIGTKPYLDGVYDSDEDWVIDMVKNLGWKNEKQKLENIAAKVVQEILQEKALEIKDISQFGEVNYTCSVKTDKRLVVVRMNAEDGVEKFQIEEWSIRLAIREGIPTPPVLYVGEVDGVAVGIFPYIEGVNGKLFPDKGIVWKNIGKYAKRIHQILVNGFGETLIKGEAHQFKDNWQRYVQYNIDSLTPQDKLIEMGVLDEKTSQLLKDIFIRLLNTPLKFGLSHGDLSERNTIIDLQGKVWLIDWGCISAQVIPHFDFTAVLDWNLDKGSSEFSSFLQGYGMTEEEFEAIYPQILDFALLQTTDKLRWAIDRNPEEIQRFAGRLKKKIENIK